MISTFDIEIVDVVSPWPTDEIDFSTYGFHSIKILENVDPITLGITAPISVTETASKLMYTLTLSQPVTTDMIVTLKDQNDNTFTKPILTGNTELKFEIDLTPIHDFYKNTGKTYSLEITKIELANKKEFEDLKLDPKKATTEITDEINDTFIDLFFVDTNDKTIIMPDEAKINTPVTLKGVMTNPSKFDTILKLTNGDQYVFPKNTTEAFFDDLVLPTKPGLFDRTLSEIIVNSSSLLEKVTIRDAASINVTLPDVTRVKITGPNSITEGIPFSVLIETEFPSFGKDIVIMDNKGIKYTIPAGMNSITIDDIISDDIYNTDSYTKTLVSVVDNGSFKTVDISGSTDYPNEVNIPLTEIKDLTIRAELEYSNTKRKYLLKNKNL